MLLVESNHEVVQQVLVLEFGSLQRTDTRAQLADTLMAATLRSARCEE